MKSMQNSLVFIVFSNLNLGIVKISLVLIMFFEASRAPRVRQSREQLSGPDRFEVQKVMFLIKNAFCLYLELCFLQQRGVHFQKIHEKSWSESEKWSRKSLDGKCDGYMWGLGWATKREC